MSNCVHSHVCCICDVYIPRSHTVAVPVGVDVDGADAHVLLATLVGVYVMVAQDNTPSSRAASGHRFCLFVYFLLNTIPASEATSCYIHGENQSIHTQICYTHITEGEGDRGRGRGREREGEGGQLEQGVKLSSWRATALHSLAPTLLQHTNHVVFK